MALIYIVEDDKNIQEIEMFALKNIDYAVEGFECAGDFYKRLYEKLPDLVLLDVMLPDEDGLEIVKKLRKSKLKKCIGVLGILIALIIITGCVNNFGKFVITKNNVRAANKNEKTIETTKPSKKSDWKLILVNYQNKINSDTKIDVVQLKNGQAIDKRCYEELQQMMDDCRDEGLDPIICSSYRSHRKQKILYEQKIYDLLNEGYSQTKAKNEAATVVAIPGTSEHEIGLAVDIVDDNYQMLENEQENTPVQKWLKKNCWKYGFILRYPENKKKITGVIYEPWHYRYVGKTAAKEIMSKGICLEEYLDE
jgi:D-alanyl-D-alanine carboxypeptidase